MILGAQSRVNALVATVPRAAEYFPALVAGPMPQRIQPSRPAPGSTPSSSGSARADASPRSPLASGLALIVCTVLAYLPALRDGYVWDDDLHLTLSQVLRGFDGLRRIWFDLSATPQYYPLVHTGYWVEFHLWGLRPMGFHAVNILLHGLSAVLLWRVLLRLEVPWAWLCAAIFALHPVEVESVAWVTERKNTLSAVFYFASALTYLRFALPGPAVGAGAQGRSDETGNMRLYWLSLGLFVAALLSKTAICTLPAALLLVLWWKRGRIERRDVMLQLPFFAVALGMGVLTTWIERFHAGAAGADWAWTPPERLLIAGRALWVYSEKIVVPLRLAFVYPKWTVQAGAWWQWLFPLGAAVVIAGLWAARARIGRGPLVAVLFFAGTLAPALGFINIYYMRYSFVADHFQYVASVGLIALCAAGLARLPRQAAAAVLLVLGVLTWRQTLIYRDIETIWRDTLRKNPDSWLANNNLGAALAHQGRSAEAMTLFTTAARVEPGHAETFNDIGNLLLDQGALDEAIANYRRAIALNPGYPDPRNSLGIALARQGKMDEAVASLREAIAAAPLYATAHVNLGHVYRMQGKLDDAITEYLEARRLTPASASVYNDLGVALDERGRAGEAIQAFRESIRLDPGSASAHFNLARKLLEQRNAQEGIAELQAALRIDPGLQQARALLELLEK